MPIRFKAHFLRLTHVINLDIYIGDQGQIFTYVPYSNFLSTNILGAEHPSHHFCRSDCSDTDYYICKLELQKAPVRLERSQLLI